ncbi:MAG: hypothetical protein IMF08_00135 [Proteobacteria bacterium]|nr:hypothetical protein [Pseudomonadota bacterium]
MEINGRRILLCDCEHTMALDGKALARAAMDVPPGPTFTPFQRAFA